MKLIIDNQVLQVDWQQNQSVNTLKKLCPKTIKMKEYGGFEQVGPLGTHLPSHDEYITSKPGDILLYCGNQIVICYGQNSWSYTRLGRITNMNQEELTQLLGNRNISLTFSTKDTF